MNVELLHKVADVIAKHPEQFDMLTWDCGTTACIAGWALRLSGVGIPAATGLAHFIGQSAKGALELSVWQANALFIRSNWPCQFRITHADMPEEAAMKAVARIQYMIETGR